MMYAIKQFLKTRFPVLYGHLFRAKNGLVQRRVLSRTRKEARNVDQAVLQSYGDLVATGPFRGMRYVGCTAGIAPKVLGTYERELHDWIAELPGRGYECVLNIGCAEGYYSVGLARLLPDVTVHAYDTDARLLSGLRQLAAANGVDRRIVPGGFCDHRELDRYRGRRVLVLCDIEGAEAELLDPQRAVALYGFDMLVELHDGSGHSAIRDLLTARFKVTHDIALRRFAGRTDQDYPDRSGLDDPRVRSMALDEHRGLGLEWAFFQARAFGSGGSDR